MSDTQPRNAKPASVWNSGGGRYNEISRGIADSIEHCVLRLDPRPGETILHLATGTGYQVGDAENLPFEDGAVDAVISTFGVMSASRPEPQRPS